MTPLGIGLIGLGRHGMRYARHLLGDVPGARLVSVCRRSRKEGERFGEEHRVHFHADYGALIADPAVQAVLVVTPPSVSRLICLEAVRARKPILVEKPLAPSAAEAREIVAAAEAEGVPIMTAQTLRFEAAVQALYRNREWVGEPLYLSLVTRAEPRPSPAQDAADYGGRGVLLEIGVHLLDLIRFLSGEEVMEVRCETDRDAAEGPETRAWATLRTVSGLSCVLDVSRVSAGRVGRAEWIGTRGQLAADWIQHRLGRLAAGTHLDEQPVEPRATLVDVLNGFIRALAEGGPMPVTGLDGQRAVEIADACYESAETGRMIQLDLERQV